MTIGLTLEQLLQQVQSSENELLQELSPEKFLFLNGRYMTMSQPYKLEVAENLIAEMNANGIDLGNFKIADIVSAYSDGQDYLPNVVEHVLLNISTHTESNCVKISIEKIAKLIANVLLNESRHAELILFVSRVQNELDRILGSDSQTIQLDWLNDTIIIEPTDNNRQMVTLFPIQDLSDDPKERFASLFSIKQKWSESEILPFVKDLVQTSNFKDVDTLLMKHARLSKDFKGKCYTSK